MNLEKIIDQKEIKQRVGELGTEISSHYQNEPLTIICVLKGSLVFTADLIRNIDTDINVEFLRVSSYTGTNRGKIKSIDRLHADIEGKNILIVEDIVDSGNTINFIADELKKHSPESIRIITLLYKEEVYNFDMKIDWIGFNIKNDFVVGYGLDFDEKYRNKKSIYKINKNE